MESVSLSTSSESLLFVTLLLRLLQRAEHCAEAPISIQLFLQAPEKTKNSAHAQAHCFCSMISQAFMEDKCSLRVQRCSLPFALPQVKT